MGVTRVVRNLTAKLAEHTSLGEQLVLVAVGGGGFRVVDEALAKMHHVKSGASGDKTVHPLIRLFTLVSSTRLRTAIVKCLSLAVQVSIWRLYSRLNFAPLSRGMPMAQIGPGDLVVLGDASWTYDVMHCARLARKRGAIVVTLVYDLIPISFPQYCAPLYTAVLHRWIKEIVDVSHGIICISATTQQEVERYCHEVAGCEMPLEHFRLGSDLDLKDVEGTVREQIAGLCAVPGVTKLFLTVGSIEPRKNHSFIMDAFERIWAVNPEAMLVVVGRPTVEAGSTLARLHGHPLLGKRIFVFHDASDAELDFLYRHAMALVFASAVEGFGLPLVEARQRGCLVLASDIPAFRELADSGVTLFSLDNPEYLARIVLGMDSTSTAAHPAAMPVFGWRASADEFLAKIFALAERAA